MCLLILFLSDAQAADDHKEPLTSELRQDQTKTDLIPAGEAYILPFGRPKLITCLFLLCNGMSVPLVIQMLHFISCTYPPLSLVQ